MGQRIGSGMGWLRLGALGALAIVMAGCVNVSGPYVKASAVLPNGSSVAVLPFENLTNNPNAGQILGELASTELYRRGAFSVIEPTKVRAQLSKLEPAKDKAADILYAGSAAKTPMDADKTGRALGVHAVLIGSVSEYGYLDALREEPVVGMTVRLIRSEDGAVLWASSGSSSGNNWFSRRTINEAAQDVLTDMFNGLPIENPAPPAAPAQAGTAG